MHFKKVEHEKTTAGYPSFIRQLMLNFPGVSERICFGTSAFYGSKKPLA